MKAGLAGRRTPTVAQAADADPDGMALCHSSGWDVHCKSTGGFKLACRPTALFTGAVLRRQATQVWLSCTCAVPAELGALQGLEERLPDTGALGLAAGSPGSPDGDQAADGEGGTVGCACNTGQPGLAVRHLFLSLGSDAVDSGFRPRGSSIGGHASTVPGSAQRLAAAGDADSGDADDDDDLGDADYERAALAGAPAPAPGGDAGERADGDGAGGAASPSDSDAGSSDAEPARGAPGGRRPDGGAAGKAASFARAFAKVMGSAVRPGADGAGAAAAAPILAGSKSLGKRKREEAETERSDRAARQLRLEMRRRGHIVRPGHLRARLRCEEGR